jgi:hypothetical protein
MGILSCQIEKGVGHHLLDDGIAVCLLKAERVDLARGKALHHTVLLDHGNAIMLCLLLGLYPQET